MVEAGPTVKTVAGVVVWSAYGNTQLEVDSSLYLVACAT